MTQNNKPDTIKTAMTDFLKAYPKFSETTPIDTLRDKEYSRLDAQRHIYLDYTGGGLYGENQLDAHINLLRENIFGNPHSSNPSSLAMTHLVEQARAYIRNYFNASPDEYIVIFTPNASGALKLVGESYPFAPNTHYMLTFDNHNSVNGIREFARAKKAKVTYVPICLPDLRVDEDELMPHFDEVQANSHNLFAYPAQSNFSGVQHPLTWIEVAHSKGWDVLLDAAAFVPTNPLDLSQHKPDFVSISFYKMFGYPTGIGCLLARKAVLGKLQRPWFAGGTITVASVQGDKFYFADNEAAFEDGTINYLSLPAIEIGLKHINDIGIDKIHARVSALTGWLLDKLATVHHSNGAPLVRIYGPLDTHMRGGTVTLNVYDPQENFFDHRVIEAEANKANISLRTGCFCNPGGGEIALGISSSELVSCFSQPQSRITLDDFRVCIDGKSTGAVRISVGLVSNFADVYRFIEFIRGFVDKKAITRP